VKLGRYDITLSKQKAPSIIGEEQGSSSGGTATGYFSGEESLGRVRNPSIKQIMDMIDNDGNAQALYNVISFPVDEYLIDAVINTVCHTA